MKAAQRRRLAALLAKDQATLSDAEKSELATLQQLAIRSAAEDTGEDESDESAEGEGEDDADESDDAAKKKGKKKSKKKSEGEDDESDDESAEGEDDDEEEDDESAPAAPAANTSLLGTLRAALSGFKAKTNLASDLATARASIASLTTARDTAISERDTARTEATRLRSTLEAFATYFAIPAADLGAKSSADILAGVAAKISSGVTEKLTELGVSAEKLPAATTHDPVETLADIQTQMATEKDPKKLGQLAAKANKLRDQISATANN